MNVKLSIRKDNDILFESVYQIRDSGSFASACADAWTKLRDRRLGRAASIGEYMDLMNQSVLEELQGAEIRLSRA
ncbi:MAG: hypothetical protein K8H87_05200 [Pseudorhodoplanes sp.]|nr:MAG: hypothetical protein F9K38_04730 [Pseudorhodoplanes sp.]MBZ0139158.1 hypothetical protein [Pseudorhodoplanes sp.]